jgi:hypothetical protein
VAIQDAVSSGTSYVISCKIVGRQNHLTNVFQKITDYGGIGEVLLGPIGRDVFGAAYIIYCVFCMASHLLTFTIAMNVLTNHATCTIVWGVVGLVIFSLLSMNRTLKNVSFLSIICKFTILRHQNMN